MIQRFHGIDRHKHYSTISVKNREGKETSFIGRCDDLRSCVETLGPNDAVAIESSTGSFFCGDQIESRGCLCFALDPFRFKIIRESWKKCDKHDSRNMAAALWVDVVTGEFGLPTVYKPDVPTRELRKLFAQYQLFSKQAIELMNNVQAILTDNGVVLNAQAKKRLFDQNHAWEIMDGYRVSPAGLASIRPSLEQLWHLQDAKRTLRTEILRAGKPFRHELRRLITIRAHIAKASPHLRSFYEEMRARRGVGRARVALIRKVDHDLSTLSFQDV